MHRSVLGFSLGLLLGVGGVAQAKSVVIDFTGASPVEQGLKQVNKAIDTDGVATIVQRGGQNVAATGGTDAARYLYLQIDPAFKQTAKSFWVTVGYFDEGTGGFKLQDDGQDDAYTLASSPPQRWKFDKKAFQKQTWHLLGSKLQGGQEGGADLRIDDRGEEDADGPEFIATVTVSDEDPDLIHFPYAVNKITIDGKAEAGEWDGAFTVKLDRPHLDAVGGSPNWKGPEDFSGTYSFKYDENAFYVLGRVTDATPRLNNNNDEVNYYNGDGTEQMLGLDDSDVERTGLIEGTDFKVEVGLGDAPGWSVRRSSSTKESLGPIGKNFAITNETGGYLFELQIPWKLLNPDFQVKQGQRIAWYMFANNSTVDPSGQEIALGPAGRTGISSSPFGWIRAVLDPKPSQ